MKNREIQNLRAIAMLAVLLGHMPIALPNVLLHGYSFVSLFFVISGYCTAVSFTRKHPTRPLGIGKVLKTELINRALRLLPLMFIWVCIYFIVGNLTIYYGGQYGDMSRWAVEIKAALSCTYNYYLASLDIGGLFGQYWSLFVEIHFFILFLLIFVFVWNKKSRIIVSAGIVLLTVFFLRPLTPVKLIRYATLAHLDSLFCGVLIGLCCGDKVYLNWNIPGGVKRLVGTLLCLLLFLSGYIFDNFCNDPNVKYLVYTVLSSVILFLAREKNGWFDFKGIAGRIMTWCGDTSASVYVSHVLLYSCIYYNLYYNTAIIPDIIKTTTPGVILQVIALIVAACLVGRASFNLIEVPYGDLAKKYRKKQIQ